MSTQPISNVNNLVGQPPANDVGQRGNRGGRRSQRARQRAQQGRTYAGKQVMAELKEKLDEALFTNLAKKFDSMSLTFSEVATMLPITTRAFGFIVHFVYFYLISVLNQAPIVGRCTIHQLYRIVLVYLDYKLTLVRHEQRQPISAPYEEEVVNLASEYREVIRGFGVMFGPIAQIFNMIGNFEYQDKLWYPRIPVLRKKRYLTVRFANLREIVVLLSNPATPADVRRGFYNHNPIPGALWATPDGVPLLMNPNDIIPPIYGANQLREDLMAFQGLYTWCATKVSAMQGEISFDTNGSKYQLVTSQLEPWRVFGPPGVQGSEFGSTTFWTTVVLTPLEMIQGAFGLFEIPVATLLGWTIVRRREGAARETSYNWSSLATLATAQ